MSLRLKRIFVIFGLIFALLFSFASPIFNYSRPASAYTTADSTYAAVDPAYAWIGEGVWENIKDRVGTVFTRLNEGAQTHIQTWIENTVLSLFGAGLLATVGTDPPRVANAETFADAFTDGYGLLGGITLAAGAIYETPPDIHLASFFREELSQNLLASPTHATFGTDILNPVYDSWTVMRNLAYALFIAVAGAIALMIILRRQIAPRVVVTVTSAIPKIFTSLILITLSFPLAAFFIDLFVVWLPNLIVRYVMDIPVDVGEDITGAPADQPIIFLFGGGGVQFILGVLKIATSEGIGAALGTFAALILMVFIAIAAICVVGLIVLQLLYRYARIIILTIFGPLILLLGSLPGQEGAISGWFKDLAVSSLVFPGILIVAIIAFNVLGATSYLPLTKLGDIPGVGPVFFGGPIPSLSGAVICLILLLASFKIPGLIESAIKGRR